LTSLNSRTTKREEKKLSLLLGTKSRIVSPSLEEEERPGNTYIDSRILLSEGNYIFIGPDIIPVFRQDSGPPEH